MRIRANYNATPAATLAGCEGRLRGSGRRAPLKRAAAETFISRLHKVRATGDDRWTACCPAHDDSNPSMSISIKGDRLLTYCHARQCPHEDILAAVGMKISDFYDDGARAAYRAACTAPVKALEAIDLKALDRAVVRLARADLKAGKPLSIENRARYLLAVERLKAHES